MNKSHPTQVGPYRIIRLLGEGGMGAVYEAVNEQIERRVAIKCLHPEYATHADASQRFFNEARAANRIGHPSIVQISDYGIADDGSAYIVMELLDGQTLATRLHNLSGPLPLGQVLTISWQIAAALTAAHEKQIVHRDLKPENVMLVPDAVAPGRERVKLLDFGVAKLATSSAAQTAASVVMGTPRYMSPEQAKGSAGVDDRSDVYSLGVMLFEMLAGRRPFLGDGAGELIAQHIYKEPPPLASLTNKIPVALTTLVDRLLHKDPLHRPKMEEIAIQLEKSALECGAFSDRASRQMPVFPLEVGSRAGTTSTLGGEVSQPQRSSALIGGVALLGLALLIAVGVIARGLSVHKVNTAPPAPPPALVVAKPAAEAKPEARVTWTVRTSPLGAKVVSASGEELGQTPLVLTRVVDSGSEQVTLRLAGYSDRSVKLALSSDVLVNETLEPAPRPGGRTKREKRAPEPEPQPAKATSYEN